MMNLVLASKSPRRRELLTQAGFSFQVMPALGREKNYRLSPAKLVEKLALDKAQEVFKKLKAKGKQATVLGADTLVFLGSKRLGQPKNARQAKEMLTALSAKSHTVITGLALIDEKGKARSGNERTRVWFRKLSEEEIDDYVRGGEPMDKAGAYGIQGEAGKFVKRIEGDYFNVVGLPMARLIEFME